MNSPDMTTNDKSKESSTRLLKILAIGVILIAIACIYKMRSLILSATPWLKNSQVVEKLRSRTTVDEALVKYGDAARQRLKATFNNSGAEYPPKELLMLGLKAEANLQIYARGADHKMILVCSYPIVGTSGVLGPKLKEGDLQMPEGFYRIQELEPNTPYHLAMRVNYPNEFDKAMGQLDKRTQLGGDIMIHGSSGSIGCLAMGDQAAEDLFVLVNDVGLENTTLVMSPFDFRNPPKEASLPTSPRWVRSLYSNLQDRVMKLPAS
jgi:murein L,D-transpeptidase YafK